MNAKAIWFAFGVGVSAGAAVALLYAPQSGLRTRKQIRRGMYEAGDYLEDAGNYLKAQADKLSTEAQNAIAQAKGSMNDLVDEAVDRSSGALRSAKSIF